jgi:hypothetical protein
MPASADELAIIVTAQTQQVISGLERVEGAISQVAKEANSANASIKGGTAAFSGMATGALKMVGVLGTLTGGFMLFKQGLSAAAGKEQGEMQFTTLLGSAEAAKERMAELAKFANETPFSNEQVITMSKSLQAMTGGALASGDGLRLVGDTAAALNPGELERFSMHIGRMYSQIQNGQSFGESMKELQELGAISGTTAAKLRTLSESGQVNADTWKIVEAELNKNKGAMAALAGTAGGAFSTLLGTWNDVLADAFRPLSDALIPIMTDLTGGLEGLRPKMVAIGEKIAQSVSYIVSAVKFIFSAFQSGDLTALVVTGLKLGGAMFVNWFFGILEAGYTILNNSVFAIFRTVSSGEFWQGVLYTFAGLGDIIRGVAMIFIGGVLEAGREWFSTVVAAIGTGVAMLGAGVAVAGATLLDFILQGAAKLIEVGQRMHIPGLSGLAEGIESAREALGGMNDDAKEVLTNPGAVFDSLKDGAKAGLSALGETLQTQGKELVTQGLARGAEGIETAGGAISEGFEGVLDGVNVAPKDIIDTSQLQGEMGALVDKHWTPPLKKMVDETKKGSEATKEEITKAVDPSAVADSLSKIGGGGNLFAAAMEASTGGAGSSDAAAAVTEGVAAGAITGSSGVDPASAFASGVTSGALNGSSGLGAGAAVGGSLSESILQSIDNKISEIISLMGGGGGGGGGLSIELS